MLCNMRKKLNKFVFDSTGFIDEMEPVEFVIQWASLSPVNGYENG